MIPLWDKYLDKLWSVKGYFYSKDKIIPPSGFTVEPFCLLTEINEVLFLQQREITQQLAISFICS